MREELKNLNEMNDSRELLEAKPNPIMPLFIYLIITVLVIALIWTYFGEIDQVVKANGVVRTDETISTVRNQVSNKVADIHFSEGQLVKEGEILFTFDQSDQALQKSLLEEDLQKSEEKVADLELLKESIDKDKDLFDEESKQENEIYERYVAYKSNLALMKQEFEGTALEVDQNIDEKRKQKEGLASQKDNIENKIEQLKRLKGAIQEKENVFGKDESPYYNRIVSIELTIERMESTIQEGKQTIEELQAQRDKQQGAEAVELDTTETSVEGVTEEVSTNIEGQVKEAQRLYEEAQYDLEQYINEQLLQVTNEIEQAENQLTEINATLQVSSDFSKIVSNQEESYQASVDNYKSDLLVQVNTDKATLDQQVTKLKQELTTLEEQIKDSVVKAPITGVVNVRTDISKGDFLQAGTEVLTIVPGAEASTFKVQLSVLNKDIADTKVGDEINFRLHALPYQEYGQLKGKVTKISTDAVTDQESGMSYYMVDAVINNEELHSYKGEEAQLKVGMTTEAHIVTESKKILYFLLEKIDLRD